MNRVNPKALLHSKWTKLNVVKREKHFMVTKVEYNEDQSVEQCIIEAVITKQEYTINWRDLKDSAQWQQGWK